MAHFLPEDKQVLDVFPLKKPKIQAFWGRNASSSFFYAELRGFESVLRLRENIQATGEL
ncbi:MAG: hypothetical protein JST06_07945 [Bacteroidetes bacterium]|nr:hypothetical protein [Bacteroidota bacterium]